MDGRPIGFLDSGRGGLCVRDAVIGRMPLESTCYAADLSHCPYGNRPPEEVTRLVRRLVDFLFERRCKAIVLACNTATAAAVDVLRGEHPDFPFIGMEPAIKPAAAATRSGVVAVLATAGTFKGRLYRETCRHHAAGVQVIECIADEFVRLVEAGTVSGPEAERVVRARVEPLIARGADELVLGCTHFPHLKRVIELVAAGRAEIVDSAQAVAAQVERIVSSRDLAAAPGSAPAHEFFAL